MIDCLDALKQDLDLDYSSVKSIVVRGPKSFNIQHMLRRPSSSAAAQYSVPFVVGATIAFGSVRWDAFEERNLASENILRWADLVHVEDDEDLERNYPQQYGAEVQIESKDGHSRKIRKADGLGSPTNPLSWNDLIAKAERLTDNVEMPLDLQALTHAIESLFEAANVETLNANLMTC